MLFNNSMKTGPQNNSKERISHITGVVQWLSTTLKGMVRTMHDGQLVKALDAWLLKEKDSNNEVALMIGPVACNACDGEWEAMAYSDTLKKLECPHCGESNSQPL